MSWPPASPGFPEAEIMHSLLLVIPTADSDLHGGLQHLQEHVVLLRILVPAFRRGSRCSPAVVLAYLLALLCSVGQRVCEGLVDLVHERLRQHGHRRALERVRATVSQLLAQDHALLWKERRLDPNVDG